ncbi:MAG: hypothetical protein V3W14_10340 [Candidatus Neomarinimicrobiota bacterium]
MDLKDKLNLLWKYLFLIVVVITLAMIASRHNDYRHHGQHGYAGKHDMGYCYMGGSHAGMDMMSSIKVEKMITNGDTSLVVWVDGEKVDDPEAFLKEHGYDLKGGDHYKMKWKGRHDMKKKKIRVEVEDDHD